MANLSFIYSKKNCFNATKNQRFTLMKAGICRYYFYEEILYKPTPSVCNNFLYKCYLFLFSCCSCVGFSALFAVLQPLLKVPNVNPPNNKITNFNFMFLQFLVIKRNENGICYTNLKYYFDEMCYLIVELHF